MGCSGTAKAKPKVSKTLGMVRESKELFDRHNLAREADRKGIYTSTD
jgi:hypothetical protein